MDSTVRNLINFLCYNPQTKIFDTILLQERLGITVHPSLAAFYKKNPDPSAAADRTVHSDWAQMVISDIPFVSYNSTLPAEVKASALGFVKVDNALPELKAFLQKKQFTVLKEDQIGYELNPSMKNLIIVLDYLLGLKLFADEPLQKAFMRDDFVQLYLPKLAAALKTSLTPSFVVADIDKKDYTSEQIKLPLAFYFEQPEPYAVNLIIKTTSGHGEIEFAFTEKKQSRSSLPFQEEGPISGLLLIPTEAMSTFPAYPTKLFVAFFTTY